MRKILVAICIALLPLAGFAQDTAKAEPSGYSLRNILLVSAGAVVGVVLVDLLVGGALTVPPVAAITPAMREAGAAGAVFGDQVAAATAARDAKARLDVLYALFIGGGAVLGGLAMDRLNPWGSSSTSMSATQ